MSSDENKMGWVPNETSGHDNHCVGWAANRGDAEGIIPRSALHNIENTQRVQLPQTTSDLDFQFVDRRDFAYPQSNPLHWQAGEYNSALQDQTNATNVLPQFVDPRVLALSPPNPEFVPTTHVNGTNGIADDIDHIRFGDLSLNPEREQVEDCITVADPPDVEVAGAAEDTGLVFLPALAYDLGRTTAAGMSQEPIASTEPFRPGDTHDDLDHSLMFLPALAYSPGRAGSTDAEERLNTDSSPFQLGELDTYSDQFGLGELAVRLERFHASEFEEAHNQTLLAASAYDLARAMEDELVEDMEPFPNLSLLPALAYEPVPVLADMHRGNELQDGHATEMPAHDLDPLVHRDTQKHGSVVTGIAASDPSPSAHGERELRSAHVGRGRKRGPDPGMDREAKPRSGRTGRDQNRYRCSGPSKLGGGRNRSSDSITPVRVTNPDANPGMSGRVTATNSDPAPSHSEFRSSSGFGSGRRTEFSRSSFWETCSE